MNKSELIKSVAEQTSVTQELAKKVINATFETIEKATMDEGRVAIAEFGIFKKHESAPRQGRNPATGAVLQIPAKTLMKFKPSKA
jgi:nucleoid DNA-binding protein